MIVISSSLPKSASTILCTYQEEMLAVSGRRSGQMQLRRRLKGRYVEQFGVRNTGLILAMNWRYGDVIVKTHSAPTTLVRLLLRTKQARATYIYRDPRDVVLSAVDHGARTERENGRQNPFRSMTDVAAALPEVKGWLSIWETWQRFGNVYFLQYEDLVESPWGVLADVGDYLGWSVDKQAIEDVVSKHQANRARSHNFNKGQVSRYRNELDAKGLALCNQVFGDYINAMGYSM